MRIQDVVKRLDNPGLGLDLLRIYLGVALLVRGATFLSQSEVLASYMERGKHWFLPVLLSHYVVGAHIAGGILLALGLGTRVAALVQVPILAGAVFLVHWGEGLLNSGQSLELSALVLVMLAAIGTFGPGHFSLDYHLEQHIPDVSPASEGTQPAHAEHEAHAHP
ncbi:MAG TPA: DoxX family protein [Polyangiaceae bacterium]